jgi:heat shock protein HslJ
LLLVFAGRAARLICGRINNPKGASPMRFARAVMLCVLSAPLVASGALAQPRPAQSKPEKSFPIGPVWVLQDINGRRPPAGAEATLRIDQALRGTGAAGCNNWSATMYPRQGQRLAVGPIALTRRSCPQPEMAFERAYLVGLHRGPQWSLAGDTLVLRTVSGVMRFRRSL